MMIEIFSEKIVILIPWQHNINMLSKSMKVDVDKMRSDMIMMTMIAVINRNHREKSKQHHYSIIYTHLYGKVTINE